jgi:para-nitrobenzyl esterase
MLDIVAALRWVRDNIAAFGGDPENVTLFGQSGGGFKISMLMAMPAARGLFHKAIVQSGSALRATLPEIATRHALWTLDALGLDPSKVAALESVPLDRLIAAATAVLRRVSVPGENPFTPVLDGGTLPRHPFDPDAPPGANAISMLIGTAKDESRMLLAGDPGNFDLTPDRMRSLVTAFLDGNAETADGIIAVIEAERPGASSSDIFFALTTARMLTANAIAQAERQAARGTAFLYRFDWNIPILGGKLGAPHGVTTPFVFRTIDAARSMVGSGSEAHGLSEKISAAWLAFARTGDPNHAGLPPWPPYDATARATMILDNACRVVNDPDRALRLALSALAPMQI